MQRYDSYKDSGVKWLGEIPSHWEVVKTSHLFTHIGSGTTPKSGSEEYYTEEGIPFLQTGDLNDSFIVGTSKKITEKALRDTNLTIYLQGSLVIAMYGATIGKLGILGIDTTVNQACCVLPKSPKVETRFAFYAYLAAKNDLIFQSKGGGQPNISQDTIKSERIPVPSKEEQTAIANYLDAATAKIDAAIAQQQKIIDLLNERKQIIINRVVTKGLNPNAKMKDSGVEWIGEVPEGWEVRRLKYLLRQITAPSSSLNKIGLENIESGTGKFVKTNSEYEGNGVQFEKGDILYGKLRPYLKKVFLAEESGNAVGDFFVFRPNDKVEGMYMQLVLLSQTLTDKINSSTYGAKMPRVSIDFMGGLNIPLPSIDEQKVIVEFIHKDCKPIDNAIDVANKQISLLQERNQIIINEVVMGKIKVV